MKNTRSRNWRKLTLEQRVRRAYNRLPKFLKELETKEEKKQTIRSLTAMWRLGYFVDKKTGKSEKIGNVIRRSLKKRQPRRTETKRDLFRRFRMEDSSTFARYNSYMFRHGFKSTEYYMQNAKIDYVGRNKASSLVQATLELPEDFAGIARIRTQKVKYTQLTLTYDYSGDEFYAELS